MLCRSAEEHGFGCADIYHAFNGTDGTKPSGDLLSADYTHPSDRATHASPVSCSPRGSIPWPDLFGRCPLIGYLLH